MPRGADDPFGLLQSDCLDIADSGRLFFEYSDQTGTHYHSGIYTIMADGSNGHFVPIVINQEEFDWYGFDSISVESLSVSGDGNLLVFCALTDAKDTLYAVNPAGENLRKLVEPVSYSDIYRIDVSHSGNMIMFEYTPPDESKRVLRTVPSNGGGVVELGKGSDLTLHNSTAVISPDGNWVAAVAGGVQDNTIGIAFIRTDGGDYHWVDTGEEGLGPHPSLPLSFSLDGKTVVFCGYEAASGGTFDIFAVNNDRERPNLRNLTNTPELSESWPLLR